MSYSDKNKIFFGLLHYIFSEQSNVDWAFKTSLINFTGINENISQKKYKNNSISNDIIKYVREVKPYHVQFDHYIEKFTSKSDDVKIIANESLFPEINVRYDAVSTKPDIEDNIYCEGSFIKKEKKKSWGKFSSVDFSTSLTEDGNDWCHIADVHFENNYTLPLVIKHKQEEFISSGWENPHEEMTDDKYILEIDWVERTSSKTTTTHYKAELDRNAQCVTNWTAYINRFHQNTASYSASKIATTNQSKIDNGATWNWIAETYSVKAKTSLSGSDSQMNEIISHENNNVSITREGKTYSWYKKGISAPHDNGHLTKISNDEYKYTLIMRYNFGTYVQTISCFGKLLLQNSTSGLEGWQNPLISKSDNKHLLSIDYYEQTNDEEIITTFNTSFDYNLYNAKSWYINTDSIFPYHNKGLKISDISKVTQLVCNNPSHNDYWYSFLIHCSDGYVIPGYWDKVNKIKWLPELREKALVTYLNGAVYEHSTGKWVPVRGWDSPDMLQYDTDEGANADNQFYATALQWNWDEGRLVDGHPSVTTNRINFVIDEETGFISAYDTYNNNVNIGNIGIKTLNYNKNVVSENDKTFSKNNLTCNWKETKYSFTSQTLINNKEPQDNEIISQEPENISFTYKNDTYDWNNIIKTIDINNISLGKSCIDNDPRYTYLIENNYKTLSDNKKINSIGHIYNEREANSNSSFDPYEEHIETFNNDKELFVDITSTVKRIPKANGSYNVDPSEPVNLQYIFTNETSIIYNPDGEISGKTAFPPIYNKSWVENTPILYNSSSYIKDKWILANGEDNPDIIYYTRNNTPINSILYNICNTYNIKWNYGIKYNNHYSYFTDVYYAVIDNNGYTLKIFNKEDDSLFKEYSLDEFTNYVEEDDEYISDFDYSNLSIGDKFFNKNDKCFYRLAHNDKGDIIWKYDSIPLENNLYYFKKEDKVKIYEYRYIKELKQNVLDFYELTTEQLRSFENTTMANRLFLYKTHDLNLIEDYLDAHFKGITINGGDFNIDRFGYDAFLYDLKAYDTPCKTIAYCLVKTEEDGVPISQVLVGERSLVANSSEPLRKENLKIISSYSGEILDYSIKNNIISLYTPIKKDEKITINYNDQDIQYFISNTFDGVLYTDEISNENYLKYFFNIDNTNENEEYELNIPYSELKINKLSVSIEEEGKNRIPTTNYTLNNNKIYLYIPNVNINTKIYISIADSSILYDKIYTWEDIYGIANNESAWKDYYENSGLIQNIDGGNLLNPSYEKNRPEELTVIYPQNTLLTYFIDNDKTKQIFSFDFKDKQDIKNVTRTSELLEDFLIGDTELKLSKDVFKKPYIDKVTEKLIPGKVLINSELFEFYDYQLNDDKSIILKKLRRGINGTFINKIIKAGSIVYPFNDLKNKKYNLGTSYYYVRNPNIKEFIINGNISNKELVSVYKTKNITLLSDITPSSKSFIISDNGIIKPTYTIDNDNKVLLSKGYLFINNDKVLFDTITSNPNGTYTISDFDLPLNKKYLSGTSIQSNKLEKIDPSEYEIITEKYEELYDLKKQKKKNYIVFNNNPMVGEYIVIENHNKNLTN